MPSLRPRNRYQSIFDTIRDPHQSNREIAPPEIFKNIVNAPITFLVVRYNKLQSFCLLRNFQLVAALIPFINVSRNGYEIIRQAKRVGDWCRFSILVKQ